MIRFTDSAEGITAECLQGFFAGWPRKPSPETHRRLLEQSDHVGLALDETTGRVIGFITAISDGILSAYIPHLEVLPDYQGRGIGSELVRRMLTTLDSLYGIDLCCDAHLRPFYERFGMRAVAGMILRNYDRQAG